MKTSGWFVASTSLFVLLAACGGDGENTTGGGGNGGEGGGGADPAMYYSGAESAALGASGNKAKCSTCHSNDGTQMNWSGNTFKDIAYRMNYKGGMAPDLLAASNECIKGWMGGTPLTTSDPKWTSLEAYMQSLSDKTITAPNAIMPEVLANEAAYEAAYAGGDAAAGAAKYAAACGRCHDSSLVVNASPAFAKAALKVFSIGRIAQKARTAGPPPSGTMDATDTTPGPMPFFEEKDLATQDLKDIIAHLKM